ncbi:BLUF domain-containing protein [Mucilaginibacter sp. PAMB04274]|uniref:BLUF domain-containing protein n=1 Tax=Mucilaginibacter sp. PAMB04274 TaxID=3138568 RepID=UPI0031F6F85A
MKYLVYISSATKMLNQDELLDILTVSRQNNERRNLTGLLLYGGGTFIQVLEGEELALQEAYNIIAADDRHTNILKMTEGEIAERLFPEWNMAFKAPNAEEMAELGTYVNPGDKGFLENPAGNSILKLLSNFANTNRMVEIY